MATPVSNLCPSLNNLKKNPDVVTKNNLNLLRLSNYDRKVGASVKVSCVSDLKLYGSETLTCQKDLTWSSQPYCNFPPSSALSEKTKMIIGVSTVTGFLVILTLTAIIYYLVRKYKEENDSYKHMRSGSICNSVNSLPQETNMRYGYPKDAEFYGPKTYLPGKRFDNIHMNPVNLPQQKSEMEIMESAIPRLPSNASLDGPRQFRKKKYDFEEFNVYALRQGRDPFLWRPVITNMNFSNLN